MPESKHKCTIKRLTSVAAIVALCALLLATSVSTAGVRWTDNGVEIRGTGLTGDANVPQIISDGAGGAIIAWNDWRDGVDWDVYAQRVDPEGNPLWSPNGVQIRGSGVNQDAYEPQLTSDMAGGAIITWRDFRSLATYEIYAQRVDADGNVGPAIPGTHNWIADGVKVCGPNNTREPQITSDMSGGAIIAWYDSRNGFRNDVYAQRVDADGNVGPAIPGTHNWIANGVEIRGMGASNSAFNPETVSDMSGGAIITWDDYRSGSQSDIYAQRVDADGNVGPAIPGTNQWIADGVEIRGTGVINNSEHPQLTSDISGGAIITWQDYRSGSQWDIYAQRVDSEGRVGSAIPGTNQWIANGVEIRGAGLSNDALGPKITSDQAGGGIITWYDLRSGSNYEVYAQKVTDTGECPWTANGVVIRDDSPANDGQSPRLTTDGSCGAIITWEDNRNTEWNTYTQRVDQNGATMWAENGELIRGDGGGTITGGARQQQIATDQVGGGIITWLDARAPGGRKDVYAQRVSREAPVVTSVTPGSGLNTGTVSITDLAGNSFHDVGGPPEARLLKPGQTDIMGTGVNVVSPNRITCDFDINGAEVGQWDVFVRNADGQESVLVGCFAVEYPAPTVTSMTPSSGPNNGTVSVTDLKGTGFRNGASVQLIGPSGSGESGAGTITASDVSVASSTKITCKFDLDGAAAGSYKVKVTNTDSKSGEKADAFTVTEAATPTWYLAEGSTAWGFSCYITIENPKNEQLTCDVTYMPTGANNVSEKLTLPAKSQTTLTNDHLLGLLGNVDFSTRVTCDQGKSIGVDRTMSWTGEGAPSPDGHCSVGVTSPAKTWYLPEGSSEWGFESWLLIQNPDDRDATVNITYMIEGRDPVTVTETVPARSRKSYSMGEDIGSADASVKVDSNVAIIPERAMYRNNRREGHDSIGTTAPAADYYLAEGSSAWGFTTYVLIQNPQTTETSVNLTYMTPTGEVPHPENPIVMPANSRKTIRVDDYLPESDFSTKVSGNQPIIAERAMYWGESSALGEACHDSIGMASPHTTFYLPDGQTTDGRETWTLIQNPNDVDVTVEITYMTPDGEGNVVKTETIPASSRKTFGMLAQSGMNGRASIMVTSKTSGKPIMVERAMYWNSRGAGTDTIGGYED